MAPHILASLQELYYRLPRYNPTSMLDFGTGPGTAIW